jgi:hypothetical protein
MSKRKRQKDHLFGSENNERGSLRYLTVYINRNGCE